MHNSQKVTIASQTRSLKLVLHRQEHENLLQFLLHYSSFVRRKTKPKILRIYFELGIALEKEDFLTAFVVSGLLQRAAEAYTMPI